MGVFVGMFILTEKELDRVIAESAGMKIRAMVRGRKDGSARIFPEAELRQSEGEMRIKDRMTAEEAVFRSEKTEFEYVNFGVWLLRISDADYAAEIWMCG
jgi:hypothetical protein